MGGGPVDPTSCVRVTFFLLEASRVKDLVMDCDYSCSLWSWKHNFIYPTYLNTINMGFPCPIKGGVTFVVAAYLAIWLELLLFGTSKLHGLGTAPCPIWGGVPFVVVAYLAIWLELLLFGTSKL